MKAIQKILFIGVGPWTIIGLFHKIAKPVPLNFAFRNGAAQHQFPFGHVHNFPVTTAGPIFNINFLSNFKRVKSKDSDIMFPHFTTLFRKDLKDFDEFSGI
jgi:hypothetical protein